MVADVRSARGSLSLLLVLVVAVAACGAPPLREIPGATTAGRPGEDVVQLRHATLPAPIGILAVHPWFVAYDPRTGTWSRWEVWQHPERVPTSWGHVHRDLMPPDSGVGGGPPRVLREWRGETARRILGVLFRPEDYPDRNTYRAWPGPNSNTYAAWVLREAKAPVDLHPMGIGKDWAGLVRVGLSPTRTGLQADLPLVGAQLGLEDGAEVHALGLTLGFDLWPPALKTPVGRLGFPEPIGD